jgi:hypothetical protein
MTPAAVDMAYIDMDCTSCSSVSVVTVTNCTFAWWQIDAGRCYNANWQEDLWTMNWKQDRKFLPSITVLPRMRCGICLVPFTCYTIATVSDTWTQFTVACQVLVTERLWRQFYQTNAPHYSASISIPPAHTTMHIPVSATDLQPNHCFLYPYLSCGPVAAVCAAARYIDQCAPSSRPVLYCIAMVIFSTNLKYADKFNLFVTSGTYLSHLHRVFSSPLG